MTALGLLRNETLVFAAMLFGGGLIGWAAAFSEKGAPDYQVIAANDLEPFRSAFNAASGDVRAVLLVGPT